MLPLINIYGGRKYFIFSLLCMHAVHMLCMYCMHDCMFIVKTEESCFLTLLLPTISPQEIRYHWIWSNVVGHQASEILLSTHSHTQRAHYLCDCETSVLCEFWGFERSLWLIQKALHLAESFSKLIMEYLEWYISQDFDGLRNLFCN